MDKSELNCQNCGQTLDPLDKFCRQCGLPTVRQAQLQRQTAEPPPDTAELRRALDAVAPAEALPDPKPFVRAEPEEPELDPEPPPEATTSSVLKATSPTQAMNQATSTLLMVGLIVVMAVVGMMMLVMAFQR